MLARNTSLMSCLNFRLPPAKKAWQKFTSKLQIKLHKLHKSKAIKKPKNRFNPPPTIRDHNRRKLFHPSSYGFPLKRRRNHLFSQKKTAPVYIDKLFREPVAVELVADFSPRAKTMKIVDKQGVGVAESTARKEERKGSERGCVADDMWESLGFASPQMRGIDERAEQFIASFRADMEVQEMVATELYIDNGSL